MAGIKNIFITFCIFMIILPASGPVESADMIYNQSDPHLRIFYTETDRVGWNALLKGRVLSIGADVETGKDDISGSISDRTKVSVRLYDHFGVEQGDTLFVINNRNLIVSRIKVASVFKSIIFGYMLIGYGNFRLANEGDRVAQRIESDYSRYACFHKARGDYYAQIGENGNAINSYKKAIELDKGNPEAHLALGNVYLSDNLLQFAFHEFNEAYRHFSRLYDNEDRFCLLKGMAEIRFREAYYENIPADLRGKYIKDGIKYSEEALRIYPGSRKVNYYLGMFYYKSPEPDDVKARDQFLKVIELDPENADAYTALADLYYKHDNMEKAVFYAEAALKIDPAGDRARFILNLAK